MNRLALLLSLASAAPFPGPEKTETKDQKPLPPVILNEIHYHPSRNADLNEEFVELLNRTDREVDLHGWALRGGVRFRFDRAAGPTLVPPRGFLLVARNPASLAGLSGAPAATIAGPFQGKLSNSRDRLSLLDPSGTEVETVEYAEDGAWPARADGLGPSLQRVSSEEPASLPRNWRVGSAAAALGRVLFADRAPVRWFEDQDGHGPPAAGVPWYHPDFDDQQGGFRGGRLAVGYDLQNRKLWIRTRATPLAGLHALLIRIPFDVPADAGENEFPTLLLDWDDGFIAWLNGVEIARRGMRIPPGALPPADGSYAASVVNAMGDASEPQFQRVWAGSPRALRPGRNVLAIGNYNASARSSDLYLAAKMVLGSSTGGETTPGAMNSVAAAHAPPGITLLERQPMEPGPADRVVLRARVEGPDVARVELGFDQGSGEGTIPLKDDGHAPDQKAGDGIYAVELPPAAEGAVVRFRMIARDSAGGFTSYPREGNRVSRAGYYVSGRRPRSNEDLRVHHLLWNGNLQCQKGAWRRGAVFVDRGTAYLDVGLKNRGETSCGRPKSSLKVKFNQGDLYEGQKKLNLLAGWEDRALLRERLAWDLFRDIGHPSCRAELAAVYAQGGEFQGLYVALEEPGRRSLKRNGLDPQGGLWKCRNPINDGQTNGFGGFLRVAGDEDGRGQDQIRSFGREINTLTGQELIDYLIQHLDVEAFIEYQAVKCLISDEDGYSKNWLLHHAMGKAGGKTIDRWMVLPWDLDLSFGQVSLSDDMIHTSRHPLLGTRDNPRHGSGWNGVIEAVFGRESRDYFVKALYGRIWSLLEEKFGPEALGPKIERIDLNTFEEARADLQRWPRWGTVPQDAGYHRDRLRKYVAARSSFLRGLLVAERPTVRDPGERGSGKRGQRGGASAAPFRRFRYTPAPRMKITAIRFRSADGDDLEYFQVENLEKAAVDLAGWNVPAVDYVFPPGSEAPAAGVFIIARSPQKLAARFGSLPGVKVFGPYPGHLPRSGADLRLRDSGWYQGQRYFPETIDVVKYRTARPWPAAGPVPAGAIELRDLSLDNDLPESWRPSPEREGSPGKARRG